MDECLLLLAKQMQKMWLVMVCLSLWWGMGRLNGKINELIYQVMRLNKVFFIMDSAFLKVVELIHEI